MKFARYFLLVFLPVFTSAQSTVHAFFQLSGPEKCWVIGHLFKAKRAFTITKETRLTVQQEKSNAALDTFNHGGKIDAFRHTYWMMQLTRGIGEKSARKLGKAHEKGNYKAFKKGKGEDGVVQDATAVEMDLLNNEQGIAIALAPPTGDDTILKQLVITAVTTGKLFILKRDSLGRLCDCNGLAVPESTRSKREWKLPYCLIPSY